MRQIWVLPNHKAYAYVRVRGRRVLRFIGYWNENADFRKGERMLTQEPPRQETVTPEPRSHL